MVDHELVVAIRHSSTYPIHIRMFVTPFPTHCVIRVFDSRRVGVSCPFRGHATFHGRTISSDHGWFSCASTMRAFNKPSFEFRTQSCHGVSCRESGMLALFDVFQLKENAQTYLISVEASPSCRAAVQWRQAGRQALCTEKITTPACPGRPRVLVGRQNYLSPNIIPLSRGDGGGRRSVAVYLPVSWRKTSRRGCAVRFARNGNCVRGSRGGRRSVTIVSRTLRR